MQTDEKTNSFNEDVAAIVRVARLANAFAFAGYSPGNGVYIAPDIRERQFFFGAFLTAGHLHDVPRMVDQLAARYGGMPEFAGLLNFGVRVMEVQGILGELKRNPAFTMDWTGEATAEAVRKCYVDLKGVLESATRCYTYEFYRDVAKFDLDFVREGLRDGPGKESLDPFVVKELPKLVKEYEAAAKTFIRGLHARIAGSA